MDKQVSIPPTTAWLLSAFFAVSYVASVYTFPNGRLVYKKQQVEAGPEAHLARIENANTRNDPATIKARLAGVTMATLSSLAIVYAVVVKAGSWNWNDIEAFHETRRLLGFTIAHAPWTSILCAPILYIGPIYWQYIASELPFQWRWKASCEVQYAFSNWVTFRNVIAAPITEELVYRSCILAVMQMGGASRKSMLYLSPLWFGAAHLHHGWDTFNRLGKTRTAFKHACLSVLFQQLYTSLFGIIEVFMFVRTKSVLPCIFAHGFCNAYGVPLAKDAAYCHPNKQSSIYFFYSMGYLFFALTLEPLTRPR